MHWLARHGLEGVRRITPAAAGGLPRDCCWPRCCRASGVPINGARRWLGAGPLQFQPSELMKLALVLHAAAADRRPAEDARELRRRGRPVLGRRRRALRCSSPRSPTSGTALVIAFTLGGAAGRRRRAAAPARRSSRASGAFLVAALRAAGALPAGAADASWTRGRTPAAAGFQAVQGQIAIGSGGLFGVGLGQSVQKIFYLPEAHTDFILAVIGEELGAGGRRAACCSSTA